MAPWRERATATKVLRVGEPLDPHRHDYHPETLQQAGYAKLAIHTYSKARNRRSGQCRCGALPVEGMTARGEPYRTCARCLSRDRAYRARRLAAWKTTPRPVRSGITGMPYTPPRRIPPPLRTIRVYQRHVADLRKACEAEPVPSLTDRQAAFVRAYVESGNGERAALAAGYGALSASRGGRAAAVAACRLLRRAGIRDAIAAAIEAAKRKALKAAVRAELARRRVQQAAHRESLIAALAPLAAMCGPQSGAARLCRRMRGEPVLREPGRCRCGARADPRYASCAPCRHRHRDYRRATRERERRLRTWRRFAQRSVPRAVVRRMRA